MDWPAWTPRCSVKVAVHEPTGAEVAVKVMNKDDIRNKDLTVSVRREVAIMKALRHKNIVSLHRVLSSSTRLYVIMDLVHGSDLEHHIAEAERAGVSMSEDKARNYFRHIVDGVVHCHERRVYHRDLKVRCRGSGRMAWQVHRCLRCVCDSTMGDDSRCFAWVWCVGHALLLTLAY